MCLGRSRSGGEVPSAERGGRVGEFYSAIVDTLSPGNGSASVPISSDLIINFNESVTFGSGFITIRETAGGAAVESYDVGSPPASLSLGGSSLTIHPTADLANSTGYHVEIDATAIDDLAGNSFAGISGTATWGFTTEAPDTTDPTVATLNPSNGGTDIPIAGNLEVTFSESVAFGSGFITIRETVSGFLVESYDVGSPPANLTLGGATLTIDPTTALSYSTGYHVEIDAAAIDDLAGNSYAGISGNGTWAFATTDDPTAGLIGGGTGSGITVTASSFNDGGAGFPAIQTIDGSGLSEGVHSNTVGTSWLTPNSDPSADWIQWDLGASYVLDLIQVWNVNNNGNNGLSTKSVDIYVSNGSTPGDPEGAGAANWTKLGGASLTLPQAPASNNIGFDLATATSTTLPATGVRFVRFELNGNWLEANTYAGIAEIQFFSGSVGGPDDTPPAISTLDPINTAIGVDPAADLSIAFNEDVAFGSGFITLRELAGDAVVESYDVASPPANLSLSGGTITINPGSDLALSTGYYVEIDATAIDDLAGNSFAGISGSTTWSFTTGAPDTTAPMIDTLHPANGTGDVPAAINLAIDFTEEIAFGTGSITLKEAGGAVVESFDVASPPANLTLAGSTVTIDPASDLSPATGYYVEIDAAAIDDLAGNSFAGFGGDTNWSFTTAASLPPGGPIDSSGITATASTFNTGGAGFPPIHTIDESGLDTGTGVHNTSPGTSWLTPSSGNISAEWIQWDLGASYVLGSIHVWNANQQTQFSTKSVDIYVSNVASPGDPEGAGAANWTKLSGATVTLPQANNTGGYTGFDLETAIATTLPTTAVRFVRFELNSSYAGNEAGYTGIAEIQFFEAAISPGETFSDWISGFTGIAGLTALDDDADGDGIDNGVENYFGTHPGEFSQGLVMGSLSANTFTFTHPLNDSPASDLTAAYRWSGDLATFNADGGTHEGTTVTFAQGESSGGMVTVTATIAGVSLDRLFVHIETTQN